MTTTLVAGIRYKPITLANIVKYLKDQNYPTRNIGESLRSGLELLEQIIITQKDFKKFEDIREAITYLQYERILNISDLGDKSLERLSKILSLDNVEKEREFELQRLEALKHLTQSSECTTIEDIKEALGKIPKDFVEE